jgi:PIN domain nuclease of toxin-antitoxin system
MTAFAGENQQRRFGRAYGEARGPHLVEWTFKSIRSRVNAVIHPLPPCGVERPFRQHPKLIGVQFHEDPTAPLTESGWPESLAEAMVLLDTCVLLWLASDQRQLSEGARELLRRHRTELFLSAVSPWEIAWKHRMGKLTVPVQPTEWIELALETHGVICVTLDLETALAAAALPPHHRDPP